MRQKLITLDPTSWDLAARKSNFSQWVRDKLRSEDNRRKETDQRKVLICRDCGINQRKKGNAYCLPCQTKFDCVQEEEE